MKNIVKQYTQSVAWSTVEAVIFQSFLLMHQAALFKVITPQLYGLTGTLFGLIYFGVKLFDLGLSRGLMTYYHNFAMSQHSCRQFLDANYCPTLFFALLFFHHYG